MGHYEDVSWLLIKRLSKGKFVWWPEGEGRTARRLEAWQAQLLLAAGDASRVRAAPVWRPVGSPASAQIRP